MLVRSQLMLNLIHQGKKRSQRLLEQLILF